MKFTYNLFRAMLMTLMLIGLSVFVVLMASIMFVISFGKERVLKSMFAEMNDHQEVPFMHWYYKAVKEIFNGKPIITSGESR